MSHPSKRLRVETSDEEEAINDHGGSTKTVVQDKEVWFPDGNIDIVAEGTVFRVHRNVLSTHSEVFHDMLSIPQPTGTSDEAEHPIVEVSDTAEAIRHLLLVLYYRNPHFKAYEPAEYKIVSSLAHIAHKYQVKNVLDDAMARIKAYYPDDLKRFSRLESLDDEHGLDIPLISDGLADPVDVIRLARLVGDKSLLRPAFYRACQLLPWKLMGKQSPTDDSYDASQRLSDADLDRCIVGIAYLANARLWAQYYALNEPEGRPRRKCDCNHSVDAMQYAYLGDPPGPYVSCAAFERMDMEEWSRDLCGKCAREIDTRASEAHEIIWDTLPGVFGLGDT